MTGPRVVQGVWNSKTTWNEADAAALRRILSIMGSAPLAFTALSTAGKGHVFSFANATNGATWVSSEATFGHDAIVHFTVNLANIRIETREQGPDLEAESAAPAPIAAVEAAAAAAPAAAALAASVTIHLVNFHQTVRLAVDAQKFQAAAPDGGGGAAAAASASTSTSSQEADAPSGAMMELAQAAQKKMGKAASAYKKDFIDPKKLKGQHKPWDKLSAAEKRDVASGRAPWDKPPKAAWVLSSAEDHALGVYQGIQAKSLHASAVGGGKLSSGNKDNTAAAAAALGIDAGAGGFNIPVTLNVFRRALSERLIGQNIELPSKAGGVVKICLANITVEGG